MATHTHTHTNTHPPSFLFTCLLSLSFSFDLNLTKAWRGLYLFSLNPSSRYPCQKDLGATLEGEACLTRVSCRSSFSPVASSALPLPLSTGFLSLQAHLDGPAYSGPVPAPLRGWTLSEVIPKGSKQYWTTIDKYFFFFLLKGSWFWCWFGWGRQCDGNCLCGGITIEMNIDEKERDSLFVNSILNNSKKQQHWWTKFCGRPDSTLEAVKRSTTEEYTFKTGAVFSYQQFPLHSLTINISVTVPTTTNAETKDISYGGENIPDTILSAGDHMAN